MKIRNIPLKTTQSPCWNQGVNNCALGCHCWRLDQGQGGKEEALPEGLQPTEEVPSWWRQAYTNRRRTLLLCQVPQVWSEIFIFLTLQSLLYDQGCMQGWTSFNLKSLCRVEGFTYALALRSGAQEEGSSWRLLVLGEGGLTGSGVQCRRIYEDFCLLPEAFMKTESGDHC